LRQFIVFIKARNKLNLFSMFNFFTKTIPAFGLDLSGSSIKVVQLKKGRAGTELKSYTETPLPKGMVINDAVSDSKTFSFLLKESLNKPQYGKIDTNYVVASLPESKSFVRVIQIPKMSIAEAESAVPYEAENFIPMPIDQVYLDWQKIGETQDKMNVLMIASPKEFVDKYLEILDKADIKVAAFEVEAQSCHRALIPQGSQDTVLLVDISDNRTSLIMVEDGNLQFTSTIPIAGNSFTESLAKILGVSVAKAEEVKHKVGLSNTSEYPNIKTALLPVLSSLSAEIKNILKFHSEHSEKVVNKIILSGGSAKLKNIDMTLASQLSDVGLISVELGSPWVNLPQLKNSKMDALNSLGFVTAIGLAQRGVDYQVI
jgi:type IV pilus assembly protein PilM